ncbi:hypothetical protein CORC01_11602 [Colletotrichum orchidophilum]|uniref:Uncharacterized protein n=1 Tax=Colletotrichum orchidophilum TaxID=1209926 RepID=A0A1G4AVM4_9PEZI|nr:uncharacterized protein CORC01_11602 [Colletotrichum orchidophilum]OHE93113.1 hypothetical protein CORC01_11602 [Colletotrichum orchidophilum]
MVQGPSSPSCSSNTSHRHTYEYSVFHTPWCTENKCMDTTEQSRQSCVITQRRTIHANPLAPGPRNTTHAPSIQARNRRRVDDGPVEPPGLLVAVFCCCSWDLLSSALSQL